MPSAPRQPYADSDRELARQVRRDWEHYREVAANPRRAESSVRSALRDVFWSLLGYGESSAMVAGTEVEVVVFRGVWWGDRVITTQLRRAPLTWENAGQRVERVTGIEPAPPAWNSGASHSHRSTEVRKTCADLRRSAPRTAANRDGRTEPVSKPLARSLGLGGEVGLKRGQHERGHGEPARLRVPLCTLPQLDVLVTHINSLCHTHEAIVSYAKVFTGLRRRRSVRTKAARPRGISSTTGP